MAYQKIIFDFDGVIIDSFHAALETVREHNPGVTITEVDYRSCFEGNVYEVAQAKNFCSVYEGFFERYLPRLMALPPIEGRKELVEELAARYPLVLVSSTDSSVLRAWLESNGIGNCFEGILGSDISKSKVEKFRMLMEKDGLAPEAYLFVTDTLGDLREAEKVGISCIAVTGGFHSEETLKQGKFFALAHSSEELKAAIEGVT